MNEPQSTPSGLTVPPPPLPRPVYRQFVVPGRYRVSATPPPRAEPRWVRTVDLTAAAVRLAGKLPPSVTAVAGVPRSGLMPAAVIATALHLPLYELREDGGLYRLGHGKRAAWSPTAAAFRNGRAGALAVIDDTVYTGTAMRQLRAAGGGGRVYAAVYCRPEAADAVDLYGEALPGPHLLEWNILNCCGVAGSTIDGEYWRGGVATDLDGILAHDDLSGGPVGAPYLLPRAWALPLIVTGRQERHHRDTERWLDGWGARYGRLEMLPDNVPQTAENAAAHKARHYGTSDCGFFLESCPIQAEIIHQLTGKSVICPRAAKVWL